MFKIFDGHRMAISVVTIFTFASCNNVQNIPFPKELSQYKQPQTIPLELTDPKPLHWDTIGRATITSKTFPLDVGKLKALPYDADGFKSFSQAPATISFNFSALASVPFTPEKNPEVSLNMKMERLHIPGLSAKYQKPVKIPSSVLDLRNWQQISSMGVGPLALLKDPSGEIWIGGGKLVTFDGTKITTVLTNVTIPGMSFDKDGNLWCIDSRNTQSFIYKIDMKHQLIGSVALPFLVSSIIKPFCDQAGAIWIPSTRSSPVFKIDTKGMSYQILDTKTGLTNSRYFQVIADVQSRLWLASNDGIDVLDRKAKKVFHLGKESGMNTGSITALVKGPDDHIYAVASRFGLLNIDVKNDRMDQYHLQLLSDTFFYKLVFDKKGQLWMAGSRGLNIVNFKNNSFRRISQQQGIIYERVADIMEDNGKMLVVNIDASSVSGTICVVGQYGKTVFPFKNIQTVSVTEDSKGNLWIGTFDELLVVDSSRKFYWKLDSANGLASSSIQNISEKNGKIVICTNGGYNIYDPDKNLLFRTSKKEGLTADTIYNLMTDENGNDWIASVSSGILKFEKTSGLVLQLKHEGGLNGNTVIQSLEDKDHKIWIATYESGPFVIDPKQNTIQFVKKPVEINTFSNKGMYEDSKGRFWFSGFPEWGLYMIDPKQKTLTRFTNKEGLADNSTFSVLGYNDKIFVNANNKINIITPPEISETHQWEINVLLHSDAFKKAGNSWMSDAISRSGNYLWGEDGLGIIYGLKADTSSEKDYVTGLKIMDKEITFITRDSITASNSLNQEANISSIALSSLGKEGVRWDSLSGPFNQPVNLSLPYDQNVIQFSFTELGSGRYDSLQFAYILEGQDKKWVTTNDLSTQTYLNLSPGKYVFKVASKWKNGKWNTPATFSFSIRSPWYQTWWAYLLYLIVAVVLIRGYIVFRSRKLRKENKLLEEKVNRRTEELQQSYNNVEKLEEIGKKITSSLSVENIIGTVYKNVNTLMDASVFGIGLYNDSLNRLEFPATYEDGKKLPFYANSVDDKNRLSTTCFNSGKDILMGNVGEDHKEYLQQIPAPIAGEQAVSLIYLPLVAKEKKLGVITVQSFKPNAYSDYHVYMLRNIAIYTAIALENARSYEELKATQSQLIQSEKMASLGELTAGIAHEIQNPLNFVNNFSEINSELIDEMKNELNQGNVEGAIAVANDISENEKKINHHGKRADAIVKGMLQHSRSSNGQKEPTNINTLSDEYLRLAYHGLRAKDKSFNADMQTDFDESIPKINVVAQDVGRVILNLITNAFYAVKAAKPVKGKDYQPTVWVSTKKENGKVYVTVKDNGTGIPDSVKDKIFHPFFTTKPTGEGTGLGLSLSYDIIKAHHGEIKAESREGQGTEFMVELPVT